MSRYAADIVICLNAVLHDVSFLCHVCVDSKETDDVLGFPYEGSDIPLLSPFIDYHAVY